jgi:gliding motility-associated-like protein
MSVIVDNNLLPTFTALGPYCVGAIPAALSATSTNGITGTWSPATISTATAGTTVYTFTPTAGQCATTTTMSVTVNSNPSISLIGQNPACNSDNNGIITVNIAGGNPDFDINWNGGSDVSSASSYQITGLIQGSYNISVSDINGCFDTEISNLTEPAPLVISVVFTPIFINGGTSNITVTATGGTSPYSGTGTFTVGAGTFTYIVTDANGCTDSQTIIITEPAVLIASSTATSINCFGEMSTITVTATGGVSPYTGTGTFTVSAGSYSYTVTDSNGSTSVTNITIVQPAQITVNETISNALCYGNIGSATITVTGGGTAPYTILWQDMTNQFTNNNIPTVSNFEYTVTDLNSCTLNGNVSITQPLPLNVIYTGNNTGCYGENNGSISLTTISGGTQPYYFEWSNGYTLPSLSNLAAGIYSVTVSDINGCEVVSQTTISGYTQILATTHSTQSQCGHSDGSISVSVNGGNPPYSYIWNNGSTSNFQTGVNPGFYSVTITDANLCSAEYSTNVASTGFLDVNISITQAISCFGGSDGIIQASSPGAASPATIIWSNGSTTPTNSGLSAGNYFVSVNDAYGCAGSAFINIANPQQISMSASISHVKCNANSDGNIILNASGGAPPYTAMWNNSATGFELVNIAAGIYTVTLSDNNDCSLTNTYTVNQPETLVLITDTQNPSCYGINDGFIKLTTNGGTPPFTFYINNGIETENAQYNLAAEPGFYTVGVEDGNSCTDTKSLSISSPEAIIASYDYSNPSCIGNNDGFIEFTVLGGTQPYTYYWNENLIDLPLIPALIHGEYSISITDANNCSIDLGVVVLDDTDIDCIKIPNAFTPNDDGVNDSWIIENIEIFPGAYLQVFNRWGQEIWAAKSTEEAWNGKFNDNSVPAGSYIYVINLHNGSEAHVGLVTVVY